MWCAIFLAPSLTICLPNSALTIITVEKTNL